jgi:hypothetical protein
MKDVTGRGSNVFIGYAIIWYFWHPADIYSTRSNSGVILLLWTTRILCNDTRANKMITGSCLCTANKYMILDEAAAAAKKVS